MPNQIEVEDVCNKFDEIISYIEENSTAFSNDEVIDKAYEIIDTIELAIHTQ